MNVRTLKKHREPIKDCPQPDSREITAPSDFEKFWRGIEPIVSFCTRTDLPAPRQNAWIRLVHDVAVSAWDEATAAARRT